MSYAINGRTFLGDAVPDWTGAPSADPRIVKAYSKVLSRYGVANIAGTAQTADVITRLKAAAEAAYPGSNVTWVGWTTATDKSGLGIGHVGFDVIIATDMTFGDVRSKNFQIGQTVGPQVSATSLLTSATTFCQSGDCTLAAAPASTTSSPATTTPATPSAPGSAASTAPATAVDAGFFSEKFLGIPMWGVLAGGAVLLTGLSVFALGHKKGVAPATTANARRRKSRGVVAIRRAPDARRATVPSAKVLSVVAAAIRRAAGRRKRLAVRHPDLGNMLYGRDANDLRHIAAAVRSGRIIAARNSAAYLDTAVRDDLPKSFFKLLEASGVRW